MDPEQVLANIATGVAALLNACSNQDREAAINEIEHLVDYAQALESWLLHGGFVPTAEKV